MSADMLVKLYDPKVQIDADLEARLLTEGICIKRALGNDRSIIRRFVTEQFSESWADEIDCCILKGGCYLAVKDQKVIGFAGYDGLFPDYFGPIGVLNEMRKSGIGKALLLRSLVSMREKGYRYAIIGWTGPQEFYAKCVNAAVIEDSIPCSYAQMISVKPEEGGLL